MVVSLCLLVPTLVTAVSPSATRAEVPLVLTTHHLPPYSYKNDAGQIDGLAGRVVACALSSMDRTHAIHFVPWKRAQIAVQKGRAHGFFAASRNAARDKYARMSAIVADQKWTWYTLNETAGDPNSDAFRQTEAVSSFLGANMQAWLQKNNYNTVAYPPQTNEALLDMLLKKRFSAILANDQVMDRLAAQEGVTAKLRKFLLQDRPLGVYFSKSFLAGEPDFLGRFNAKVAICRHGGSEAS